MNATKPVVLATLILALAASGAQAANVTFTFDSGASGFQNNGSIETIDTLSWVSSGGNPGGYIDDVGVCFCGGGTVPLAISSPDLHLSAADYGDTLQFDIAVWYTAPDLNSIYQQPTLLDEYVSFGGNPLGGGLEQPLSLSVSNGTQPAWTHFSLILQAPGWATTSGAQSAAQMQTFLAADPSLGIQALGNMSGPAHWTFGLALDNVSLTSATPEPSTWLLMATAITALSCCRIRQSAFEWRR